MKCPKYNRKHNITCKSRGIGKCKMLVIDRVRWIDEILIETLNN